MIYDNSRRLSKPISDYLHRSQTIYIGGVGGLRRERQEKVEGRKEKEEEKDERNAFSCRLHIVPFWNFHEEGLQCFARQATLLPYGLRCQGGREIASVLISNFLTSNWDTTRI